MIVRSYSIDGISLENPMMGWIFRGPSRPLTNLNRRLLDLVIPGLPGVVRDPNSALESLEPPMPSLVVQTPRKNYSALYALLATGSILSITDETHREAPYEFVNATPEGFGDGDEIIDVTATIRYPGVFWRDSAVTTPGAVVDSSPQVFDPWEMDGLVTDAVIRLRGPMTGIVLTSGRSSLRYATLPAGTYLRYDCATGKAVTTTTDTWTGGTAVDGAVSADGPGDKFGIFPARLDPLTYVGRLSLVTETRGAGARIDVRGKAAHLAR